MVYKRSEYGHQFKVSSLVKNVPVYEELLNYRHLRREREYAHTPLSWNAETIESSESDEKINADEEIDKLPISKLVICEEEEDDVGKGEKEEQEEQTDDDIEKEKKNAQAKAENMQITESENDVEIVRQSEALRKSAKDKLNRYVTCVSKDLPTSSKRFREKKVLGKTFVRPKAADDKLFVKRSKPRRPDRQNKVPKCRPGSAPSSHPSSQDAEKPFYNFGSGSKDISVGDKKTFNIRASSAVYPAAVRAKKRNLLLIEQQLERQRTASAREKRRRAMFSERISRETAQWDTEYRRCYPAYADTEYATSDKDPRKRKSVFFK